MCLPIIYYLMLEKYNLFDLCLECNVMNYIDINIDIDCKKQISYTPLMVFIQKNIPLISIVDGKLINEGHKDNIEYTKHVVKNIINHPTYKINSKTENKRSIILRIILCSYINSFEEIVKIILEHPELDINQQEGMFGHTPLIIACRHSRTKSSEKTVELLLSHPDIDVNKVDFYKKSALIYSCRNYRSTTENTINLLLKHPNIDVNIQDCYGTSALSLSIDYLGNGSTSYWIKTLLNHPTTNLDLIDNSGNNILLSSVYGIKSMPLTMMILDKYSNLDINHVNNANKSLIMKTFIGYFYIPKLEPDFEELIIQDTYKENMDLIRNLWKKIGKYGIKDSLFSLCEKKIERKYERESYEIGIKEYIKFERHNLVCFRKSYRKNILKKIDI